MIYNLLLPHINNWNIANLFHYITFRSGLALLMSMVISLYIGPRVIKLMRKLQSQGQPIKEYLTWHQDKSGTPTMGGFMILASTMISTLLLVDLRNIYIWILIFLLISFGIIGFIDDYAKVLKKHNTGITAKQKIILQLFIASIGSYLICKYSTHEHYSNLSMPFLKHYIFDLGPFLYTIFAVLVIVGSSNAVNLTDGLDGLVIVPIILTTLSFGIISYLVGNHFYSQYLQIIHVPGVGEISIFCASLVGSGLGFLWFNAKPAEIFMGDIGSLALGSVIGAISIIVKHEIVLAIIGGLFVIEALSVIIQVSYFKISKGKRVFKMAPLHHHFEQLGWPESKVVIRFWIIAVVFALIGLASLKLR